MVFLHSETTGTIQVLTKVGEKSSYVAGASITGHLKAYSLEDTTFDISNVSGSLYKFTVKGEQSIDTADKIEIDSKNYLVKDVKIYKGIGFKTTKILLATK